MSARSGKLDGTTFVWLDNQKKGLHTGCDKCQRRVMPDEPRMQLHDNKGKYESKGTFASYWCATCARKRGLIPPIPEQLGIQEEMFDGQ